MNKGVGIVVEWGKMLCVLLTSQAWSPAGISAVLFPILLSVNVPGKGNTFLYLLTASPIFFLLMFCNFHQRSFMSWLGLFQWYLRFLYIILKETVLLCSFSAMKLLVYATATGLCSLISFNFFFLPKSSSKDFQYYIEWQWWKWTSPSVVLDLRGNPSSLPSFSMMLALSFL